jgi:small-conductance mechanosensitive channel
MYFSNSFLSTRPILNLRRSPDQFDIIAIHISFYTPMTLLRHLEEKLAQYIHRHSSHYYRKFEVEYREIENTNRMGIRVWVQHRNNFQNVRRMRERRGRLVLRLKKICEELGIEYELPVQRVVHEGLTLQDKPGTGGIIPAMEAGGSAAASSAVDYKERSFFQPKPSNTGF